MNAISKLKTPTSSHIIATVIQAHEGQATLIELQNRETVTVAGHGSSVPILNTGDFVIAVIANDEFFIIDRLRENNEKPTMANHNGQLIFESENFIGMKVKESSFRITEHGELILAAQDIISLAEELNEVKGKLVKIN